MRVAYTRDAVGRVVGVDRVSDAGGDNWSFTYDTSGRLASATRSGATTTYEYDPSGNAVGTGVGVATYDDRDRLLAFGEDAFTYSFTVTNAP